MVIGEIGCRQNAAALFGCRLYRLGNFAFIEGVRAFFGDGRQRIAAGARFPAD
ncbi:hypothetical protein D3C85_1851710 [compost metagenome]